MEELTSRLACNFNVTSDPNSTAAQHPRFAQYKSRNRVDQETRRQRILEEQKKQRFDYLNHVRNLSEDVWDNTDAESVDSQESMEIQVTADNIRLSRPGKHFRNQLMYSEWLVEVPEDFAQEWLTVICPVGKRCLVVASRGRTTAYAKSGYKVATFQSKFPGGSSASYKDNAFLDCIYNEAEGIYYILDIMCWKNHPIYDSETEFRFFWLNSKMSETPEVMTKTEFNPYRFFPLANCPCTKETIGAAMSGVSYELMQSEWMTALPENIETDWFMIACPTGKRQMVLSGMGTTCSQNKMGMVMDGFRSHLPGGNPSSGKGSCIIDCIFSKSDSTFYIIDVMYWKDQDLQDCEADFRYFWLKQRINDENLYMDKVTKLNEYKFIMVNDVPCTQKAIEVEMNNVNYQIDGLLFYKRSSPYINGITDDCLWLKPHMLIDLLGEDIKLPEFQKSRRPESFNFEQHVEKVKKERDERKDKSKPRWARKPKVNIDQLVDEISQIYIEKRGGRVPEGVRMNPASGRGMGRGVPGAIGSGRGKGNKGKQNQPIIRPSRFNSEQIQKPGSYVGSEDFQYDGETFAHLGGYRDISGGAGLLDMPAGDHVSNSGGYRKTKKSTGVYEPSGERVGQLGGFMNYDNYPDMYADQGYNYAWDTGMGLGMGMGSGMGMQSGGDIGSGKKKGMGRGMLGVAMNTPQYDMWGYTDPKPQRGRGGLLSEYQKTHHQFK